MAMAHLFTIKQRLLSFATQAKRARITLVVPHKLASLVLLSVVSVAASANSQSIKVEPEFWWAGMHNAELQLLIYQQGIANKRIQLTKADKVKIKKIDKTSPNHAFVYLDLSAATAQQLEFTLSAADGTRSTLNYQLLTRQADSASRQGFNNSDVIYLITPDRFVNANPDNDNHPDMLETANRSDKNGRHGGDIAGIRKALPYLQALGVTQLWINPLLENNQPQVSYHGYATTDFYQIDPRFGSNEEYAALALEAKQSGIGIIKDIIVNHMGSSHPWMQDFPDQQWLNGQAKWQANPKDIMYTSHRRTSVQDPYAATVDINGFEKGWFTDTMPDMNQTNPHMATYLIQNSIWWVEYAGLSGIREDTYSYADKDFLTQWSTAIMSEYPNFTIVGEEWSNNPITVSYWQAGKQNKDGYVSQTNSMMDFPLYESLIAAMTEPEGWDTGLIKLYEFLSNDSVYADPTKLVLFEGNHDTNRLFSLLEEDLKLTQMAMAYVLTSNRIPQIFYGSEILMESPTNGRNDGAVRADMPGGWDNDDISVFEDKGLNSDQTAMLDFMTTLLNYRKNNHMIHHGELRHFVPEDGIYVQFRCVEKGCSNGTKLMAIYNKHSDPTTLALARFYPFISAKTVGRNVITNEQVSLGDSITLQNKGVTLIEIAGGKQ